MESKPPTPLPLHAASGGDRLAVSDAPPAGADHAVYLRELALLAMRDTLGMLLLDASYAIEQGSPPLAVVDRLLEADALGEPYRARVLEVRAELVAGEDR